MVVRLMALAFDVQDPEAVGGFWSALLGWHRPVGTPDGGVSVVPTDDTGFSLRFVRVPDPKRAQHHAHLDLTSTSPEHQQRTVARVLELGGRHVDVGQRPDEPHVVMGDPEGDELCVIEPGNDFLADCGFVGAVACDGTREVGHFWSRAWGWPLVWDQDDETAVRSPAGGPKITWGGYPPARTAPQRVRFEITTDGDLAVEVDRLVALGATRSDAPVSDRVRLLDPDGCRFVLLTTAAATPPAPGR